MNAFHEVRDFLTCLEEPAPPAFKVEHGRTVLIRDFLFGSELLDYDRLTAFLRQHKLRRHRSGWMRNGYAIVFATERDAVLFRLFWDGETGIPEPEAILDDGQSTP